MHTFLVPMEMLESASVVHTPDTSGDRAWEGKGDVVKGEWLHIGEKSWTAGFQWAIKSEAALAQLRLEGALPPYEAADKWVVGGEASSRRMSVAGPSLWRARGDCRWPGALTARTSLRSHRQRAPRSGPEGQVVSDVFAWARELRGHLPSEVQMASDEDVVLELVDDLRTRFAANRGLPSGDQIPYEVFEHFVASLEARLCRHASERLLAELESRGVDTLVTKRLIAQQKELLIKHYGVVLAASPEAAATWARRGRLRFELQDWSGAVADLVSASTLDAQDVGSAHLEIQARLNLGDHNEALERLERLLALDPADRFALANKAAILSEHGHGALARPLAERLESAADPSADELSLCALIRSREGEFELAIQSAERALTLAPRHPRALLVLGTSAIEAGLLEHARAALKGLIEGLGPSPELLHEVHLQRQARRYLADVFLELGRVREAGEQYLALMASGDASYRVLRGLARVGWELGLREAARAEGSSPSSRCWLEENMEAEFAGGIPVRVRINGLEAAPHLERLPWVQTVKRLEVRDELRNARDGFEVLCHLELPRLTELRLEVPALDADMARWLVRAPFFTRLESLEVEGASAMALEIIVARPPPKLRVFRSRHGNIIPELSVAGRFAELVVGSGLMTNLEVLDLADSGLGRREVEQILDAATPKLRELDLTANALSEMDVDDFLDRPSVFGLSVLHIGETGLEKLLAYRLGARQETRPLRSLGLHGRWTRAEVDALGGLPGLAKLHTVNFGGACLDQDAWDVFLEGDRGLAPVPEEGEA